jgi:hypothetical protein
MFRKILVPIDTSETSVAEFAVFLAAQFAALTDGAVRMIHVFPKIPHINPRSRRRRKLRFRLRCAKRISTFLRSRAETHARVRPRKHCASRCALHHSCRGLSMRTPGSLSYWRDTAWFHRRAPAQPGSDGEMNFGVTSLAAPQAASSSVAKYSRTARHASGPSLSTLHASPGVERCLFASAAIRLASPRSLRRPPVLRAGSVPQNKYR